MRTAIPNEAHLLSVVARRGPAPARLLLDDAAILALPWNHLLCTRQLPYTGVTRGRRHVVVLAE